MTSPDWYVRGRNHRRHRRLCGERRRRRESEPEQFAHLVHERAGDASVALNHPVAASSDVDGDRARDVRHLRVELDAVPSIGRVVARDHTTQDAAL